MKSFGFALFVTLAMGAAGPASASMHAGPLTLLTGGHDGALVQTAGYGDPPGAGRRHGGGNRKSKVSKSATPGVSTTKGVSPEEADKEYRKKYGF